MAMMRCFIHLVWMVLRPTPIPRYIAKRQQRIARLRREQPEKANAYGMYFGDTSKSNAAKKHKSERWEATQQVAQTCKDEFDQLLPTRKRRWRANARAHIEQRQHDPRVISSTLFT